MICSIFLPPFFFLLKSYTFFFLTFFFFFFCIKISTREPCWIDSNLLLEEIDNFPLKDCSGIEMTVPPDILHIPVLYFDLGSLNKNIKFDRNYQTIVGKGIIMSIKNSNNNIEEKYKEDDSMIQSICDALLEFIWNSHHPSSHIRNPLTGLLPISNTWMKPMMTSNISMIQKDSIIQKEIISQVMFSILSIQNMAKQFQKSNIDIDQVLLVQNLNLDMVHSINSINSILKRASTYFMMSSYEQSFDIVGDFHQEANRLVQMLAKALENTAPQLALRSSGSEL